MSDTSLLKKYEIKAEYAKELVVKGKAVREQRTGTLKGYGGTKYTDYFEVQHRILRVALLAASINPDGQEAVELLMDVGKRVAGDKSTREAYEALAKANVEERAKAAVSVSTATSAYLKAVAFMSSIKPDDAIQLTGVGIANYPPVKNHFDTAWKEILDGSAVKDFNKIYYSKTFWAQASLAQVMFGVELSKFMRDCIGEIQRVGSKMAIPLKFDKSGHCMLSPDMVGSASATEIPIYYDPTTDEKFLIGGNVTTLAELLSIGIAFNIMTVNTANILSDKNTDTPKAELDKVKSAVRTEMNNIMALSQTLWTSGSVIDTAYWNDNERVEDFKKTMTTAIDEYKNDPGDRTMKGLMQAFSKIPRRVITTTTKAHFAERNGVSSKLLPAASGLAAINIEDAFKAPAKAPPGKAEAKAPTGKGK